MIGARKLRHYTTTAPQEREATQRCRRRRARLIMACTKFSAPWRRGLIRKLGGHYGPRTSAVPCSMHAVTAGTRQYRANGPPRGDVSHAGRAARPPMPSRPLCLLPKRVGADACFPTCPTRQSVLQAVHAHLGARKGGRPGPRRCIPPIAHHPIVQHYACGAGEWRQRRAFLGC
jgi:hypothetical protein